MLDFNCIQQIFLNFFPQFDKTEDSIKEACKSCNNFGLTSKLFLDVVNQTKLYYIINQNENETPVQLFINHRSYLKLLFIEVLYPQIAPENIIPSMLLHCSTNQGFSDLIKALITGGADVNLLIQNTLPLIEATKANNFEVVDLLLKEGTLIDKPDIEGTTALFFSLTLKNSKVTKHPIQNNANINFQDSGGDTPLFEACAHGKLKIIQYLIDQGCNIHHTNHFGNTVLFEASARGKLKIVKYLIDQGCNIHHTNHFGNTALLVAAFYGKLEVIKYLISIGFNLEHQNNNKNTLLIMSAAAGNLNVVKYFACSVNLEHQNEEGNTAYLEASISGEIEVIKYLISIGCNVNHQNAIGDSAPILCTKSARIKNNILEFLIPQSVDLKLTNNNA